MTPRIIYGAAIGDICGSIYEGNNRKTDRPEEIELMNPACRFTDDTVLTAAIAHAAATDRDYGKALHWWANRYPNAGYGPSFRQWMKSKNPQPYNSWGNGSAMRVSPIAWYFDDEATVLAEAARSAEPTHNHPEGIKGAQAVALAVILARTHRGGEIKERIQSEFGYDLSKTLAEIRPTYTFDVSCQGSVPVAIIAFLESRDFVSAIQNAISVGGDSDTIAAITGSIAEGCLSTHGESGKPTYAELNSFAWSKLPLELQAALNMRPNRFPWDNYNDHDVFGIIGDSWVARFRRWLMRW